LCVSSPTIKDKPVSKTVWTTRRVQFLKHPDDL
jgi:hypothetical protein